MTGMNENKRVRGERRREDRPEGGATMRRVMDCGMRRMRMTRRA